MRTIRESFAMIDRQRHGVALGSSSGPTPGRLQAIGSALFLTCVLAAFAVWPQPVSAQTADAAAAPATDTAAPPAEAPKAPPVPADTRKPLQFQEGEDLVEPLQPLSPRDAAAANVVAARAWYGTGRVLEAANNFQGAYTAYRKAIELDPSAIMVYRALIQLAFSLNQIDDAIQYAMKAVELDPTDFQLLRRIGVHQASQGDYAGGIKFLEKALTVPGIEPKSALYVTLKRDLAILYEATEQPEPAGAAYEVVFEALQKPEDYKLDFRTRAQLLGDPPATYERIGQAFLKARKLDLALAAFRKSGETKKAKTGNLAFNLAQTHLEMGDANEALNTLQSYFDEQRQSKGRSAYELLEKILAKLGQSADLLPRLEKIAAADARNSVLQYFFADKLREAKQLDKAEALYKSTLKNDPDGLGFAGLAAVYRELNKSNELLGALAMAVEKSEDIRVIDTEIKSLAKDATLVEALIAEGRKTKADDPEALKFEPAYVLANLAAEAKQTDAAAEFYRHIIAVWKDKAEDAVRELGGHFIDVRRYADAAKVFEDGVNDPNLADSRPQLLFWFSNALELAGNTPAALEAIAQARQAMPDNPALAFQEAWIYYHSQQWDEAIGRFEKILTTYNQPQFKQIHRRAQFSLSNIYVQKGEMRRGEQILEDVLKETPNDPSVNNDLGYLYADQGKNLEQAESMIRKAVKAEPENGAYLDSLGWVLFKLGRGEEAIPHLEQATVKIGAGGDDTVWDHLGDVYDSLGKRDKALESWKKGLESAKAQPKPDPKLIGKLEEKIRNREKADGAVPQGKGTP